MEDRGLRYGLSHPHRHCVRVARYAAGMEGPHAIEVVSAADAMGEGFHVGPDGSNQHKAGRAGGRPLDLEAGFVGGVVGPRNLRRSLATGAGEVRWSVE